jgi:hypothetical protein
VAAFRRHEFMCCRENHSDDCEDYCQLHFCLWIPIRLQRLETHILRRPIQTTCVLYLGDIFTLWSKVV